MFLKYFTLEGKLFFVRGSQRGMNSTKSGRSDINKEEQNMQTRTYLHEINVLSLKCVRKEVGPVSLVRLNPQSCLKILLCLKLHNGISVSSLKAQTTTFGLMKTDLTLQLIRTSLMKRLWLRKNLRLKAIREDEHILLDNWSFLVIVNE